MEDLMKPRYKVIADFWNSSFKVGELLVYHFEGYLIGEESRVIIPEKDVLKYPHLFHKMQWWEERKEDEMPQVVSYVSMSRRASIYGTALSSDDDFYKARVFLKIYHWSKNENCEWIYNNNKFCTIGDTFLPATLEQHTTYTTQQG